MNNFDKAAAIRGLYHCHDKRDLAKMLVEQREELASCQRMYANACATLGEIQGYVGNDIVGIEPVLVKQLIDERDALAAHVERLKALAGQLAATVENKDDLPMHKWASRCARLVADVQKAVGDTPTTSLARRDALKQAEVLERAINVMKQPMTDGGYPWLVRVEDIQAMADDLRSQAKGVGQ